MSPGGQQLRKRERLPRPTHGRRGRKYAGKPSAAEDGGKTTAATEASPMTASAGPAAIRAGASTMGTGASEVPTGVRGVLAGSRDAPTIAGGERRAGGANLKEKEGVRREPEAHVAENTGTTQVAMSDNGVVQEEPLAER